MLARRNFLMGTLAAILPVLGACTNNQIDPQKIHDLLVTGCGIAVPLATIVQVVSATVGATVQVIVDMICSAYKSSLATQDKLGVKFGVGSKVNFVVVTGGKEIPVEAEIKEIK